MSKILVIPDAHAHPDLDNRRFDLVAGVIARHQPDVVVCLGDLADMPSLCSYDKGKLGFEGRRYHKDTAIARDALRRIEGGVRAVNKARAELHRERYTPRKLVTLGNHESRIERAIQAQSELEGTVSLRDLGFEEFGWEVHPYKDMVAVDGVHFTHNTFNDAGRERAGENLGRSLLRHEMVSVVVGHAHRLDVAIGTDAAGRKLLGMSAGCLVHPDYAQQFWAKGGSRRWWSGLVLLDGVANGWPEDIRFLSMDHLTAGAC